MKNKQSGFIIPLILAIVAILAVGGGVYLYQENKKVEAPVPVVDTNTQATVQTQQNTVNTSTTVSSDVASPKLILIYPDAEDNTDDFKRGTTINIQWNTVNKTDFPIDIHLLNESGISVQKIAANITNTGSYNWSIPTTLATGKYKIEVDSSPVKQGPAIYTQSGYFTLK